MTDSNYEAPITTDNFEECDIKNEDRVEAEYKINFIRSSDISMRGSNLTTKKFQPPSPRKSIIKTNHQKTPKGSKSLAANESQSEQIQPEDLQRDLDVKVEIVDFPVTEDNKFEELTDLYGKSIFNKSVKGSPLHHKQAKFKSQYNNTVIQAPFEKNNLFELQAFNSARKQRKLSSEEDMQFENSVKNYITVNEKISQNFNGGSRSSQLPIPVVEKIELDDTQNTSPEMKAPETQEPTAEPKPKTKYKAIDLGSGKKNETTI